MTRPLVELEERALAEVEARRASLIELSLRIHARPELSFQEELASVWLAEFLDEAGFAVERGAFGLPTAFAARCGHGTPRVAILCEYDALPGIGHACGHNIIAAAGAGAGAALAGLVDATGGSVVVLGTPAEENGGGKILMARNGAFADVDAAMMVHPAGADLHCLDALAISHLAVEYRGRAAHAAAFPHRGVNALDAMVAGYNAVAQLRQHMRPDERVHGIITDGGQAPNIVPERAAGAFYVRATTQARLAELRRRVEACFHAGALATGAEVNIRFPTPDYAEMWTNEPLLDAYAANLARLGRTLKRFPSAATAVTGSTDMGNVSKLVPSIHPMIAAAPEHVPLHSTEFAHWAAADPGQQAVVDGAKALALTALDVLFDAGLRAAMHSAHGARRDEPED